MDYLTVTQTAYLTALITTACLLGLMVVQSIHHHWKRLFSIGVTGQLVWASVLFISYRYVPLDTRSILITELARLALWLVALIFLLSKRTSILTWPRKTQAFAALSFGLTLTGTYLILFGNPSANVISLILMLMAICALIFTEQVVRNLNTHRMIKLIGLCLTFLFAYDVFMYGHNLITNTIPLAMWQARAALAFTVAGALALGSQIFKEQGGNLYLFSVSRPAAFYSTTILFSGLLIGSVSLGSYYVNQKGFLGTYLFTLALVGTLLLLFALVISRTFRQQCEVFLSKHFFSLKYDYRIEWLNAIKRLSSLGNSQEDYYPEILNILCDAVRAESGSLWINSGNEFKEIASTRHLSNAPMSIQQNEPFLTPMQKDAWIYVPQSRTASLTENNELLPTWIEQNKNIWLIAPLTVQTKLVGFVILARPKIDSEITYEDRDLMTNISTQVASNILLHQQEKVISEAKQLETYNRLSAFIMHDINNVIAQLALIGKNAERHKKNPAFIEDMIKTVSNATARMQGLVQKFNPASKEQRSAFLASELLYDLKDECSAYHPAPKVIIRHDFPIDADKRRLTMALKNLVRNAQEATSEDGKVEVIAEQNGGKSVLIIEDNGKGMSNTFINDELFKPFSTTKAENGVGIGAYLTKSYIEHLNATLSVNSKEGTGTRFEIHFG